MNGLHIRVVVPRSEELNRLFRLFGEWVIPPDDILRVEQEKEGRSIIVEAYVDPSRADTLTKEGFKIEVILDLSTIKDPRIYVSKTNRFKEQLKELKREKKRES